MPTISSLPKIKKRSVLWCLAACLLLTGGLPETGAAALSGPAVLEAMLKQVGPARTLTVRQRVESVVPETEVVPEMVTTLAAPLTAPSAYGERVTTQGRSQEEDAPEAPADDTSTAGTIVPEDAPPAIPPVLKEELTYQLPGGFRAEIRSEAIQRLYLEVGGEALLTVDGRLEPLGGGWFETFKDLFLFTRRLALHRHLARKGVDLAVASLGLWEARPVYVLGARFPDAAPAQIWVDKETLLPLRWLWTTGPDGGIVDMTGSTGAIGPEGAPVQRRRFEIRYDRWQLFGKRRYPLRVQFFEDHELVRTLAAEAVIVNPEVDAGQMNLDAVRQAALPPQADSSQAETGEDPAVDEIQEVIDIFKKRYE